MYLEIITPETKLFEGEIDSVKLPGSKGEFRVLKGHASIISSLSNGFVTYRIGTADEKVEINGGVVEVLSDKVIVLAD